jgi:hypothetical protein
MEMSITKSYTQSVTIKFQTWKYATTLSKTVSIKSKEDLVRESDKLWKQAKMLTELDFQQDEVNRDNWLKEALKNGYIKE